ncbi:MAG: cytochrome P450 [Phenylobacterium sp.]
MSLVDSPPLPTLANATTPERPLPILAALRAGRVSWMNTVPRAAYDEPIYEHRGGIGPSLLLVSDPDGVRRVLLDNMTNYPKAELPRRFAAMVLGDGLALSEGETWRAHRRIMAPAFEPRRLGVYAPGMTAQATALAARWRGRESGAVVDVLDEMSTLTLAIISEAMFSTSSPAIRDVVGAAMPEALALRPGLAALLPIVGRSQVKVLERRARTVFAPLDAAVEALIRQREQASGEGPDDLLSQLLRTRDAESGEGLSHREVRDQVVTIFLAGHETTSVALAWTWYLLSQHPEAEARLHAELAGVLGGRAPTGDDLQELPYTRAVIEEAMRLYPPLSSLFARQAVRDDVVCGRRVRAGQVLIVSPWIIHRHRLLWEEPEQFQPERFLEGRGAERPRFAYLPFGAGPRVCIGASFAMMEAVLVLATLAQQFRLRLAPGQRLELRHRATLRPTGGMRMALEGR